MPSLAQTRLDAYLAAEQKILQGQIVKFENRELTMLNISHVREMIAQLQRAVNAETARAQGRRSGIILADCS